MHLFNLAPESVHATLTTAPGARVEQHCAGVVRWRGSAIGQLSGNATHEGADANRDVLRIHSVGDEGQFRLDMDADAFRYFRPDAGELGEIAGPDAGAYSCDGPPAALVDLALGKTDENLSPGELGARTVEIVEAIYRSARSGRVESCPGEPVATS
jgi:predicted dehydrogenase